jgi:hypothetical protein
MSGGDRARLGQGLGRALRRPWKLTQAARLSIDAFAERYAQSRGLGYEATGEMPRDTWFLAAAWAPKSHSFLRGRLAGGADGVAFYAERLLHTSRGSMSEGWTAARYEIPAARDLAEGIACVPRQGPLWGGRLWLASALPGELTAVAVGDPGFDGTYEVGVVSDGDQASLRALFTGDFISWMGGLPFGKLGNDATRFEVRAGVLCVYAKGKRGTTQALDEFCARAARIAAQVQRASDDRERG